MSIELPLLSVIIPVYNGADTIGRCLDSLVAIREAERRLEVIVVNDGSTDDTLRVLEEYHSGHPALSLQILSQRNQGQSVARNSGLEVARGEYIWFVDADDWVDSQTADYLLSLVAREEETYDMLCFGVRNMVEEGKPAPSELMNTSVHDYDALRSIDGKTLLTEHHLSGSVWAFLWGRAMLEEHQARFIAGILHEDALFYWHYTAYAERVLLVPRVAYYYYQREGSTVHSWDTLHHRGISRLEGTFRLLGCAEELADLRSFYLSLASGYYRSGLRMAARYGGSRSELSSYTHQVEQAGYYPTLMHYAGCKGRPLIYLAHKMPWLFHLIARILPPVS